MKKITITLFAIAAMFSLTQCSNSTTEKICSNDETRAKIITELMENDNYMKEVMVAMKEKHSEAIATTSCDMMKENKTMGTKMMGNMMAMCKTDTSMCKMMMEKTMDMCDMDKNKCKMMMTSMKEHPKGMQSMKDMGMCDMMEMDKSKTK